MRRPWISRVAIVALVVGLFLTSVMAEAEPFAYVTNYGSGSLSVIDTVTNVVIGRVPVGSWSLRHRHYA